MPDRRETFTTRCPDGPRSALVDVYAIGKDIVRFELHGEPSAVFWDFDPEDADRIGRALIKAAGVYDLDGSPAPEGPYGTRKD